MRLPLSLVLLGACATEPSGDSAAEDSAAPQDSAGDSGDSAADSGDTAADSGDTAADSGDTADTGEEPKPPRGVLLFIGDGMGHAHVQGGGQYANGAAGSLHMESLPTVGRLRTASLSGTTDSAASATAMATGEKTYNEVIGQDRDGVAVENLLERARAAGLSIGVVTTDKLTGATPSAFVVHALDRGQSSALVAGYQAFLPDVALGGGSDDFAEALPGLPANVVQTRTGLLAAVPDGRPLFGVFSSSTMPYTADGLDAETPTLAEMTTAAIAWLDDDPDGFLLMVEGARIDHASHARSADDVFPEVVAFDEAIAAGDAWAASAPHEVTLLVTADHECGGLTVSPGTPAGLIPGSTWRWGQHTNADVPVYGRGPLTEGLHGQRLDQLWVYAVLRAAVDGAAEVTPPDVPALVDGALDDLGADVVVQSWPTTFGTGYNQLDALRLSADADGLRVGVSGVFERELNSVLVLVDVDPGAGTGLGADLTPLDLTGVLDSVITTADLTLDAGPGLGFDAVLGAVGAEEVILAETGESGGLRGLGGGLGAADDYGWLDAVSAFDDGNVAEGAPAADAAATGLTTGGFEGLLPWTSLYPAGIPAGGAELAVAVVLVDGTGAWASNQALPPLATAAEPGADTATLVQVVWLPVDASGLPTGPARVEP